MWWYASLIFVSVGIGTWLISCAQIHLWPWEWPLVGKVPVHDAYPYQWIFRFNGGLDGYTHPSYNLLPLFALLCLSLPYCKRHLLSKTLWWVIWSGSAGLSILSQSRMSILYAAILFFGCFIYMQPTLKRRIITAGCIALLGITVISITASFWQIYGSDPNRDALMEKTIVSIQSHPVIGVGAGSMVSMNAEETIGSRPHNQWLADCVHGGVIAALLSLAMYIAVGIECIRKRRWEAEIWLIIFCILSLLEPPLYVGKGLYLFCLISCGLSLRCTSTIDREACRGLADSDARTCLCP